jgi:hypothetical protein
MQQEPSSSPSTLLASLLLPSTIAMNLLTNLM